MSVPQREWKGAVMPLTSALSSKIRNMAILCAWFVVVIHCRPGFPVGTGGWWLRQLLENGITQIAVPFFFTVSGFMLVGHVAFARQGGCFCTRTWYRHEIFKRIRTLLAPFVVWNALWILMFLPLTRIQDAQGILGCVRMPTLGDMGFSPFGSPALVPLWYVRAVFILSLFSPVLIALLRRFGWRVLVVLYVVYGVCCPYVPMAWWTIVQSLTRCGFLPVQGFFYFSVGMALRLGIVRDVGRRIPAWLFVSVGLGLTVARAWFDARCWSCYLGFFSLPFLLYGLWRMMPTRPWPKLLVRSSFPIYLLHRFVQFDLQIVFGSSYTVWWYFVMSTLPFLIPICIAMFLRRYWPQGAVVVFGGR